jgi:hypothetical protein
VVPDATRQHKPRPVVVHGRRAELGGHLSPVSAEHDPAVVVDHQRTVLNRHQRAGSLGHRGTASHMEDVPEMDLSHRATFCVC